MFLAILPHHSSFPGDPLSSRRDVYTSNGITGICRREMSLWFLLVYPRFLLEFLFDSEGDLLRGHRFFRFKALKYL